MSGGCHWQYPGTVHCAVKSVRCVSSLILTFVSLQKNQTGAAVFTRLKFIPSSWTRRKKAVWDFRAEDRCLNISSAVVVVAAEPLVCMYGRQSVKCTAVAAWSNMAFTSSRSPKGSQKVTALPCISTPHCSPTSQLLHSDLRGGGRTVTSKRRHEITRGVTTFTPTRCWSPALPPGWSQSRRVARRVCRGAPLNRAHPTHVHG